MPSKSPAQARLMAADEAIYIAGLFDGEGYINVSESHRRGGRPLLMYSVGITNTYLPVLVWLSEFGGTVHRKTSRKEHWAEAFEWRCTGNTAYRFLKQIVPHLRIKRQISEEAILYREKWGHWTTRRYSDAELLDRRADREKVVCLVSRANKRA